MHVVINILYKLHSEIETCLAIRGVGMSDSSDSTAVKRLDGEIIDIYFKYSLSNILKVIKSDLNVSASKCK